MYKIARTFPKAKSGRNFVFTYNNPIETPEYMLEFMKLFPTISYIIFQLERGEGEENKGTLHYQGYIEFNTSITFTRLHSWHPKGIWYNTRYGTQAQAITYCRKQETAIAGTLREWGTPKAQGKRNDLSDFRDSIKTETNILDTLEEFPREMAKFSRFYNMCKLVYLQHREIENKRVILCIGQPRTGKTQWARRACRALYADNSYWVAPVATKNWFDGYYGQEVAIIDDYGPGGTVYSLIDLLRLTHNWTETVPIKGGFTKWEPSTVIITSNYHPLTWYNLNWAPDRVDRWTSYLALALRFTTVMLFQRDKPEQECTDILSFFYLLDKTYEHGINHQYIPPKAYEDAEAIQEVLDLKKKYNEVIDQLDALTFLKTIHVTDSSDCDEMNESPTYSSCSISDEEYLSGSDIKCESIDMEEVSEFIENLTLSDYWE